MTEEDRNAKTRLIIELSDDTLQRLGIAARIARVTPVELAEQLIARAVSGDPDPTIRDKVDAFIEALQAPTPPPAHPRRIRTLFTGSGNPRHTQARMTQEARTAIDEIRAAVLGRQPQPDVHIALSPEQIDEALERDPPPAQSVEDLRRELLYRIDAVQEDLNAWKSDVTDRLCEIAAWKGTLDREALGLPKEGP